MIDAGLAPQLARAVVRGLLPPEHALATIAIGAAGDADVADTIRRDEHLLGLYIDRLDLERGLAGVAIHDVALPMLRRREPPPRNAIRAAAHDVNGAHGFPLTEEDVEEELLELLRRLKAKALAGARPWRRWRYHG
jgi:hypothetical protein